jgi:pimeloyl-ACP methyl ester carboxylesterase
MVEVREYGRKDAPTILLLHAFGMHWSMWKGEIERFKWKYHVIVPSLEGHEDTNRSVFTTVEHNARLLSEWLSESGYSRVYAVIGVSLGGAIAIKLMSMKTISFSYAIIDAGIVPVGFNRFQETCEVSSNLLMMWLGAHSMRLLEKFAKPKLYGREQVRKLYRMLRTISRKTARNVFYSVDTYILPEDLSDISTKIAYWYGSLEAKKRAKGAKIIKKSFPDVTIRVFDGYNHAQLCLGNPELFVSCTEGFFRSSETKSRLPG